MYSRFKWSPKSCGRLAILKKFEPLQPFLMMALVEKIGARTFLDVGANVGIYGILVASIPTIERVLTFEPSQETLIELKKNIDLNGFQKKISVYPNAVSSEIGKVNFGIISALSGANSVISTSIHDPDKVTQEIFVESITLDSLALADDGFPVCMKIDIEGHELKALEGARNLLRSRKIVIQYEAYDRSNDELGVFLKSLGFGPIANIGPDHYVTNDPTIATPEFALSVIEIAAQLQIDDNHAPPVPMPHPPLRVKGPAGIAIELTGRSRNIAQRFLRVSNS
ncbi:FkbM family methyltransferase [Sphingopyxis sp. KK2]|uniref:FkbM family methyltransferase n=1 Tax=Sphingopyxis sp. KK2 TaxID=1855727 RepID=UPI00097E5AC3|nr:FkbM family methyltransferase [Sphingopyxis sp. KK2]